MSKLRCAGIGRDKDNPQSLSLYFDRSPTDDEMRYLHEVIKHACVCAPKPKLKKLRIV